MTHSTASLSSIGTASLSTSPETARHDSRRGSREKRPKNGRRRARPSISMHPTENGWHVPVKARAASAWRAAHACEPEPGWHQTALTAAAGRHGRGRRLARLPAAAGRPPPRARQRPSASHQSALIPRAPRRAPRPCRWYAVSPLGSAARAGGRQRQLPAASLQKRPARRAASHATVPGGLRARA